MCVSPRVQIRNDGCAPHQVQCGDLELEKEISDRVTEFCDHLRETQETIGQVQSSRHNRESLTQCALYQMRLLFYEKRQQSYFWKVLGSADDKVPCVRLHASRKQ